MKKQIVAASIALALALTADAKTFTWASSLDALSMDPYSTNNTFTNHFMSNIYEALVRFNDKVQIEPALAESWQSVSPTVWRFKLRRNVKFHNGEPFTADDVVFSWQRIQTPGSIAAEPRRHKDAQGRLHRRRGDQGAVSAASQWCST
jgi:peptide/nickel transport system substrate-binding protein